jgi:actin-related protein 6
MDLVGKALTNYLKELVCYQSVNVMEESFKMDDVKEKLCFVSLDVARDLQITRLEFFTTFKSFWMVNFSFQ